jgi:hypothetical protein
MPKICYVPKRFTQDHLDLIAACNRIIIDYAGQGYSLTLRQLYYQLVTKNIIRNKVTEYKRLGGIVNDARLAGLVDWSAIEDRTRNLATSDHGWDNPADFITPHAYSKARWDDQPAYVEVWIEKEALAGVFSRVCGELRVPFFACRGYTSQSEMWGAGQRLREKASEGKEIILLHFGDHDPSGIDMTRDIVDRLGLFGADVKVDRLALNWNQIEEYAPPPNPAKESDSRFQAYLQRFGDESWELDALDPSTLSDLVRESVEQYIDRELWEGVEAEEEEGKALLVKVQERWEDVVDLLSEED